MRVDEAGTLEELSDHDPSTGRRTSQTSFCVDACDDAPIVRKIQARVGNVTGIARGNFEFIQTVKYERGSVVRTPSRASVRQLHALYSPAASCDASVNDAS